MFRSVVCISVRWVSVIGCLFFGVGVGGLSILANAPAIDIEGVADRTVYDREANFRVPLLDGFDFLVLHNGHAASGNVWHSASIGFHTVSVQRTDPAAQSVDTRRIQFVVRDPARGDTEWGLSTWTPRRPVASAPSAFGSARLDIIAPRQFPSGFRVPVIAWARSSDAVRLPLNGTVELSDSGGNPAGIRMKRGVGHTFIETTGGSERFYKWQIHGITARHPIRSVGTIPVLHGTDVTNAREWPQDSIIRVVEDFRIAAGATLVVGAGTVVMLDPGVTIEVGGTLRIQGTPDHPAVLMASDPERPWGGIVLRGAPAGVFCDGTIFTGSGGNAYWFIDENVRGTHRYEQATIFVGQGGRAECNDCYWIANTGQALHGENASILLNRCLIQNCETVGQFNGGTVEIEDSALLDFPSDDPVFVDGDNDALYFTEGDHVLRRTLIGWCKDDGVDAGGSSPGTVTVEDCWIEACFHEGMALSGTEKHVTVRNTVFLNNGQGLEAGYLSPRASVSDSLFAANHVGIRFGDNYNRAHDGSIEVVQSLSLFNDRDLWAMVREAWREKVENVTIAGDSLLSQAVESFPQAGQWSEAIDTAALVRLRGLPSTPAVGVGWMTSNWIHPVPASGTTDVELEVGLSFPALDRTEIAIDTSRGTAVAGEDFELAAGPLQFEPGQSVLPVPLRILENPERTRPRLLGLELVPEDRNAGVSPSHAALFVTLPGSEPIPTGADEDEDGLPDAWEQGLADSNLNDRFFLAADIQPGDDLDGDGAPNHAEWIAATDALDPRSFLRLQLQRRDGLEVGLRFSAVTRRAYRVDYFDPSGAAWKVLAEWPVQGADRQIEWIDALRGSVPHRYYRLSVEWPAEQR